MLAGLAVRQARYPVYECANKKSPQVAADKLKSEVLRCGPPPWETVDFLTFLLVIVGGVQALVFWIQASRLKDTVDAMREIDTRQSQSVADSIAQSTRAATATENLACATRKHADLVERSFTSFERPHVFITVSPSIEARDVEGHDQAYTRVELSNFGRFPADIIEATAGTSQSGRGAQSGIFDDKFILVLGPGEKTGGIEVAFADGQELVYERAEDSNDPVSATPKRDQEYDTFLSISLTYKGLSAGPRYRTDFVWLWDHAVNRWCTLTRNRA